jgi:3'(2'), 5'-bisphosphate nucleotidase
MKDGARLEASGGQCLAATAGAVLLPAMIDAARAAGAAIMEVYREDVAVQLKRDDSPLTAADLASHRALVAALSRLTPSLPLISEEGGLPDFDGRSGWSAYWLIDPLDGTKEFLAGNGEFTVNVALIEDGRPMLGVVGVPARGQVFTGDVTAGRARRLDGARETPLHTRSYSGRHPTVVASRRHGGATLEAALERLGAQHGEVALRNVGSSLKFCLLAEAAADVYPRLAPTSEWDTAAAQAVLEAAGGGVFQLNGAPIRYNKADILNPEFVAVADRAVDWLQWFRA